MPKYKFTKEEYASAVAKSTSIAGVCRKLNLIAAGGNYKSVKQNIEKFKLDTSHFLGSAHLRGTSKGSPATMVAIKRSLIVERGYFCQGVGCGVSEWFGKHIALEMEHIDGDRNNNDKSNLLLLCPNCHSQTSTWRRGKASLDKREANTYCPRCNRTKAPNVEFCTECYFILGQVPPVIAKPKVLPKTPKVKQPRHTNFCACGKEISFEAKECETCYHKSQRVISWPPIEDLLLELAKTPYTRMAKRLGVSDNAIRKHVRAEGYDPKSLVSLDLALPSA